jgi:Tol biopolymer transport system component
LACALARRGTLAFLTNDKLYLRRLTDSDPIPLAAIDAGTSTPVFAPDGQSLALSIRGTGRRLARVSISGGPLRTVADQINAGNGFSWSGNRLFFTEYDKGIEEISAEGGTRSLLIPIDSRHSALMPELLPDGDSLLYTVADTDDLARWDRAQVVVESLKTHEQTVIANGGTDARYLPTGHIVYAAGATLMAIPFDLNRRAVTGSPVVVADGILRLTASGIAQYSVSSDGTLAYIPGAIRESQLSLMTVDREGHVGSLNRPRGLYEAPRLSPDGKRLAYDTDDGKDASVYIYDLSSTLEPRKLTTLGGRNRFPIWSLDGESVAFQSNKDGDPAIYLQRANGLGAAERLTQPEPGSSHMPDAWVPNQNAFAFSASDKSGTSLWIYSLADRKATPVPNTRSNSPLQAAFSPDGRWLAYGVRVPGIAKVFVQPFPSKGENPYEVPIVGAHHPSWSPDGSQLYVFPAGSPLVSLKVRATSSFELGAPTEVPGALSANTSPSSARNHDITKDGTFITVDSPELGNAPFGAQSITVVLNWFEELKRLTSAK